MHNIKILGIDPALHNVGWCIVSPSKMQGKVLYIDSGLIATNPTDAIEKRLSDIHQGLCNIISQYVPEKAVIEETFVNKNNASSLKLAYGRAACLLSCSINNVRIINITAKQVKKSLTGNGNADKNQVAYMVRLILGSSFQSKNHNITDAAAIALTHAL